MDLLYRSLSMEWNLQPSISVPLLLSVFIYLRGTFTIWSRVGMGRGITVRRFISFISGILILVIALVSPLDALSENLFSAHMVQHMALMLVAAPLLITSDFQLALFWALPRPWAHSLGRRLNQVWQSISNPVLAWGLFAFALWSWHAPIFFEAALRNEGIHILEHLTLLITGMLFWWVLFKHTQPDHYHYGMTIPYLFTTILHSEILGALMTFSSQPWYSYYIPLTAPWGLTPLQDQQIAGLIMWIPGGTVFTLLTIFYFAAWLNALEQHSNSPQSHEATKAFKG